MRPSTLLFLGILTLSAWLGTGSLDHGKIGIAPAQAAGGCGVGFHRGPYGGCRPNYYGGGGYYRGGVVYGGRAVYGGSAVYGRRAYGGRVFRGGRAVGFHGGRGFHR
jgi:hypothetical protein